MLHEKVKLSKLETNNIVLFQNNLILFYCIWNAGLLIYITSKNNCYI